MSPTGLFIPSRGAGSVWGDIGGTFYQFNTNSESRRIHSRSGLTPGSAFFACRGMDPSGPAHSGPDFFDKVAQIQSPLDREVFTTRMNYDITDRVTFSADVLFANTKADELVNQGGFQTFAFGGDQWLILTMPADHPLLSQQARDLFAANGDDGVHAASVQQRHHRLLERPRAVPLARDRGSRGRLRHQSDRNFVWSITATHGESDGYTSFEGIVDDRFLSAIEVRQLTDRCEDVRLYLILDLTRHARRPVPPTTESGSYLAGSARRFGYAFSLTWATLSAKTVYQAALGNMTGTTG